MLEIIVGAIGIIVTYVVVTVAVRDGTAKLRMRQDAQLKLLAAMAVRQGVPVGEVEQILRDAARAPSIETPAVSAARGPTR